MKFYQSCLKPSFIPQDFKKKISCQMVQIPDLFKSLTPLKINLEEPLPESFQIKNVHGSQVVNAQQESHQADSHYIVINKAQAYKIKQKYLAIQTGDCLPIAFNYEDEDCFIGAMTHAGWRGLSAGIITKTVEKLLDEARQNKITSDKFKEKCMIFMGPAIFGQTYECGMDVKLALDNYKKLFFLNSSSQISSLFDICINVKTEAEGGLSSLSSIYPDIQLLAALECLYLGFFHDNLHILRENTYEHPILPSYRESFQKDYAKGRRFWTHLCLPTFDG